MIDLAGSERDRGSVAKVTKEEMDSRIAINQSLSALTEVICKLNTDDKTKEQKKQARRTSFWTNHKLTSIFADCFGQPSSVQIEPP